MDTPAQSQVKIHIHCPQCRGDIDFLEEAQVIRCEFCDTSLLVAGREGVLRYVLPPQLLEPPAAQALVLEYLRALKKRFPRAGEAFLFYAPFWRMQGMAYRWVFGSKPMKRETALLEATDINREMVTWQPPPMERIKVLLTRVLDHTIPGYSGFKMGLSNLGVRTQALHLQVFDREHLEMRDSFLPLEIPLDTAKVEAEKFADLFFQTEHLFPEVILYYRLVGRKFSVIYSPIWCVKGHHAEGTDTLLVDAVGKKVMEIMSDESSLLAKLRGDETRKPFKFSEIRFLPFRCPNCGWEFPFRPFSMLHFCPTCRRLFREKDGEWVEIQYSVVLPPEKSLREKLLWVPFWRCKTVLESAGERLETMAALYRLAPPPRLVNTDREARRPIYFYIPAIKFRNPQLIHNLGSRLTFLQPETKLGSFEDGSHPLTAGGSLPEKDAQEMGVVILGSMIPQANRKARAWIKDCRVELQDPQVLYFPFSRLDLFWKEITTGTGISFQHNALSEDLPESH